MLMPDSREQVPTWWRQPNFRSLRDAIGDEQPVLLFVGSGLSIGAGLPNWQALLLKLAAIYDAKASKSNRSLTADVRSMLSTSGTARKYKEAGSLIERAFIEENDKSMMRVALASILSGARPSKAHEAIARMRWSKIITTNYDTLLEDAAGAALSNDQVSDHRKVIVTSPFREGTTFNESQIQGGARYVVKIHGDIRDPESPIVLSAESYDALYSGKYKDKYVSVMSNLLSSSFVLFLGYSHDDEDVQRLFDEVTKYAPPDKVYAVVAREGKPREFAQHIATRPTNIKFITYSPDDSHAELHEFVEYFSDPSREALYERLRTRRKPSVVMLYCGGTIGAQLSETPDSDNPYLEIRKKDSRFDAELESSVEQLHRWYTEHYVAGDDIPTELIWEILPVDSQMFSENATPELWNTLRCKLQDIIFKYFFGEAALETPQALDPDTRLGQLYEEEHRQWRLVHGDEDLTPRRFERDFTERYILGVIVRFGTDSLAYAASAMALGIQHLPCPVVITGANQPSEDSLMGKLAPRYVESDTESNLMTSLFFLQCFGHTITEVLVSFGNTIHNGINLRKRATEFMPAGRVGGSRFSEPFSFHNLSQRGQYMFRLIDGIFCDNFYPNAVWSNFSCYTDLLDKKNDLRHLRFHAVDRATPEESVGDQFSGRVVYAEISPCFPRFDVGRMTKKDGVYAALVEGYASGTFPSEGTNAFVQFLRDAYTYGLPVVLVSRYGTLATQQPYAVAAEFAGRSPVLPMFEIIAETALPLLSLVTAKIDPNAWRRKIGESKARLLKRRLDALRTGIEDVFAQRRNILSEELKHVSNARDLLKARKKNGSGADRRSPPLHVGPNLDLLATSGVKLILEERPFGAEGIAIVSRHDLVALLAEFPRLFSRIQAGPDGLEQVCNVGYQVGGALWRSSKAWYEENSNAPVGEDEFTSTDYLFLQAESVQDARVLSANAILVKVALIVDLAGVTKAPTASVILKRPRERGVDAGSFVLTVTFPHAEGGDQQERSYAVRTMTELEKGFLRKLRAGCGAGTAVSEYIEELRADHDKLLRTAWLQSTTTADWFLLGIYKGIACRLAEFLVIDNEAKLATEPQGAEKPRQSLRRRVKTRIIPSQPERLKVTYEYVETRD
jgi:L-asparaginase/Glu-tRNA(Gln) amidotransferase subunit D